VTSIECEPFDSATSGRESTLWKWTSELATLSAPMENHIRTIAGNWDTGLVLDRHTRSSEFLGYDALGHPDRVCALKTGDVEMPSDFAGVGYTDMDDRGAGSLRRRATSSQGMSIRTSVGWSAQPTSLCESGPLIKATKRSPLCV
jgi:hypothetical protein